MTRVKFRLDKDGLDLSVTGHAVSESAQCDRKVCAAASMLICALMEYFERRRDRFAELHVSYRSGSAEISARPADSDGVLAAVGVTICGFELLSASFPDLIRIERGTCDGGQKEDGASTA